jgi:CO/xanthine dehydrogenase Mo-binding subunit
MSAQIGKSAQRLDVLSKVTGEATYASDINYPDQAYLKILFAGRPHARIHSIDTCKAEALKGVLAVFTAKDVPVNEYGYIIPDNQPVLCGPGSNNPAADCVRFVGDQVAVVVAESNEIAAQARELIEVVYEDLPVVSDVENAMQPDATLVHPDLGSNILNQHKIITGDVDAGFAMADVIVEGEYHTPAQEHAYLETEAGVAYIDEEERVTIETGGQWAHKDRTQVAHALNLPEDQIRVIYPFIGGAFGGREDISVQIVLALAAMRLNERGIHRPVKIIWSREESIIGHGKRHPYQIKTKWGATKEGKITAAQVMLISDGGAYECTSRIVAAVAILNCTGPYEIPNVRVDSYEVYTNNVPKAAFRGFGGPQGVFAAESQVSKLAEALGMDPVEFRMRNLAKEGSLQTVGAPYPPGITIREVTEQCALAAGWQKTDQGWQREPDQNNNDPDQPHIKRGFGLACSHKNVGFSHGIQENAWVTMELFGDEEIEKVILKHTSTEVGQGTYTAIAQMTAHVLNVPLDIVEVTHPDTTVSNDTGSVSASRMTFMVGNAIKEAGELALQKWQDEERPVILEHQYLAPPTTPADAETGHCDPMVSYAYTSEAVEVEVDTETGQVRLVKVICANDVGKAINPQQVEGQLEGGLVQAAGYTMLENFVEKDGYVLTPNFSTYLIPTVLDIPDEIENIVLEYPDPRGPWGARGVGEMPFLPFAPAVTAAVHAATGVWLDEFPLTPERVLEGLGNL